MTTTAPSAVSSTSSCILCKTPDHLVPVAHKDRHGKPLTTVLCRHCGFVFTQPRPSPAELDHFYRADYRREYKQTYSPKPRHVFRAGKVALERLTYLLPILNGKHRVLDAGCGGGEMLFMLRQLGFDADGLEPNEGYGSAARDFLNLPVQLTSYQNASIEPGSRDVIISFHVLEHLLDPVHALQTFHEWLKEDGLMLIEVPNVFSRCQWPASRYHRGHLQHFSASTLSHAGRLAGLEAIDSFTSADGGNLMVVFTKQRTARRDAPCALSGHAGRAEQHLRSHTSLSHALSAEPWKRPLIKLASALRERLFLMQHKDPREILQLLASQARSLVTPRNGPPSGPQNIAEAFAVV